MSLDARRWLFLGISAVVGYLAMMLTNPARASLRDGLRCLRRYPQIWLVPALCGTIHAGFNLWVRFFEARAIPEAPPSILPWGGWQPPPWPEALRHGLLPALEGTASVFNCLATTFPLSALAAGLFLCNWRGYQAALFQAIRRRLGRGPGLLVHGGILLCALAAFVKPLLFGGLPKFNAYFGVEALLRSGEIINTLSFFFEYLLGVSVQTYLILLTFAWTRGLGASPGEMRFFTLRRLPSVAKWAGLLLAISALGINLPLVVASFRAGQGAWEPTGVIQFTRVLLAAAILVFCSVQALLIFHNEPLRRAGAEALRVWRRYGWYVGWLLLVAAVHFLILSALDAFLPNALGQGTWPAAAWRIFLYPLLWSALGGWLLASWVCLFRRCERNRPADGDLIRF